MRFRVFRKVDLPQPEGPMKAVMLFSGMSMDDAVQRLMSAVPQVQILHLQNGGPLSSHFLFSFRPTRSRR